MKTLWGIDLGGTKVEGAVLPSAETTETICRLRLPTEAQHGYHHIIGQIRKLVEKIAAEVGHYPETLGIGTPGTLDPITKTMKNCNTTVLNGTAFHRDIEEALGIPIKIANDANCFALAEARLGAVKQELPTAKVVFGVILGTGVGGGLVVNGQVLAGRQGISGEWGHNFLDVSGGPCYCGKVGCVETIISGKSLQNYYKSIGGTDFNGLKDIYQRYLAKNDAAATKTINRLTDMFGKAIANVINIVDPDVIVIGGGVGNIDLLYTQGVEEVRKHVFNLRLDTVFLRPQLGDSAGVFGAAMLVS